MKLGIIGAMDVEVKHLKETMEVHEVKMIANKEYVEGKIGNLECVVVQCGIGKVSAALSVQILNDYFHVTHVMNTGIAGSLNNDLNIGDIVVSSDAVYHDVDVTNFGYPIGEMPGVGCCYFKADEELMKEAVNAVKSKAPDVNVKVGRVASGDIFVRTKDKKQWIKDTFQADCCEMEGCAIAQAAYLNNLPFVIIRAISDKADESAEETYETFEAKAAQHCAMITKEMCEHLQ